MLWRYLRVKAELRRGFTLIELLVVIAIISMLVGILLPSLKSSRDRARGLLCMSNLKNIHIIQASYQVDFEYAPAAYVRLAPPNSYIWPWILQDGGYQIYEEKFDAEIGLHVMESELLSCPESRQFTVGGATREHGGYTDYYRNEHDGTVMDDPSIYSNPRKGTLDVNQPSRVFNLGDGNGSFWGHRFLYYRPEEIGYMHLDQANWVYWDGHGEILSFEEIVDQTFYGQVPWFDQ